MRQLYPPIEPFHSERLAVDDRHELHVEQCGNPDGLPVVFLHGGPGAGLTPYYRQFFDPARYRIVLFDQRGAGQSTPFADLVDNTTPHLVADIQAIREHLGIRRWVVFGGSWGSTLAIAYAETHPEHCLALVVRGIFLARPWELRWYVEEGGASRILPMKWARFVEPIPVAERGNMLEAYWKRLASDDAGVRQRAARAWAVWEAGGITLEESPQVEASFGAPEVAVSLARLEAHYFRHRCFLEPNQLLRDIDRIRHLPGFIVHGRYDLVCPVQNAVDLARAWPEATLTIVLSGHAGSEPAIVDALVTATDTLANTLAPQRPTCA